MKTCVIYHSIDLDGWMSAAIVKHWFSKLYPRYDGIDDLNENSHSITPPDEETTGERLAFLGYNYGQPIPDLSEYDKIIMCDISFPKEEMSKLWHNLDKELIWIDHHISAIKDNNDLVYKGLRDTNFAACELTWKYFMSNPIEKFGEIEDQEPMPEIVRLLGRYDCFGHKGTDEETKVLEFQYGARQCISNYEEAYYYLLRQLSDYKNDDMFFIEESGAAIYKYLCTEAKQTYKNGFEIKFMIESIPTSEEIRPIPATGYCDVCGKLEDKQLTRYYFKYENDKCNCHSPRHFDLFDCCSECKPVAENKVPKNFICINKERFNPINFGIDYHKDGYDGCACFHYANGMWNFSLYNDNGEVDCSQIAKQYGGGGHKGAAGFKINDINKIMK